MKTTSAEPVCTVSIVIKALNEERHIADCIESALRAVETVGGEVVLADSCSTDSTVEIASHYPVRIVQLKHPQERCCGVGPQMGYQHSSGEFIYILDGDMRMQEDFLPKAIAFLNEHADVGGVGGMVIEMNTQSLEYISRMERASGHMHPGEVDRLDMGGLYRRDAIEQTGYLSNRNLHSYEELDLAARLRCGGWHLWRLPFNAVMHYGHDAPPYRLLMRRWNSGYIFGLGEVLRNAWRQPHFGQILKNVRELRLYALVVLWWISLIGIVLFMGAPEQLAIAIALSVTVPVTVMAIRKKSFKKAVFSVFSWNVSAAGLLRGVFNTPGDPIARVQTRVLQEPRLSERT